MADRNEIRKAHEIVDKIRPPHEREAVRKLLPPRPEISFRETIEELKGLAAGGGFHMWEIIRRLEQFEKSYTEPAHPEFLETEADYENAPVGTVVARDNGLTWVKEKSNYWTGPDVAKSDYGMSLASRRVLRWGWGND